LSEKNKKETVYLEAEILLEKLSHPGIVSIYDRIENRRNIHIVMEHAGDENLKQKISNSKNFSREKLYKIMIKISKAVEYMHILDITHNDLKLENIVLKNLEPKIVDFGFGRKNCSKKMSMICGTPNYMSPELLAREIHYAKPCDVWALGVIFYYMLHKKFPFVAKTEIDLIEKVKSGYVVYGPEIDFWLVDVFKGIFKVDSQDRWDIGEVVRRLEAGAGVRRVC